MRKLSTTKIRLLKEYFSGRPEVSMAFLFGSYAKGQAFFDSDVDIAVYFQPRERRLERSFMSLKNFDKNTAERLGEFDRLRNIITHEYLNIRWERITNFVKTAKPLFEYTVGFVKKNSCGNEIARSTLS